MHEATAPPDGDYEHICLSGEESLEPDDSAAPTPTQVEAELHQERRGGTESALIFDGRYLGVRTENPGTDPGWYWLHLAFVDPQPVRRSTRLRRAVVVIDQIRALVIKDYDGVRGSRKELRQKEESRCGSKQTNSFHCLSL